MISMGKVETQSGGDRKEVEWKDIWSLFWLSLCYLLCV